MSPLLARVMLTIFMLPAGAAVYMLAFVQYLEVRRGLDLWERLPYSGRWPFAFVASWLFIAVYWILVWRRSVRWTERRVWGTGLAAGLCLLIAATVGFFSSGRDASYGYVVGTLLGPLLWLILTTILWRQTAAERADAAGGNGIACPSCGYNLTGLKGSRCPECGTEFTLDQLLNNQRGREGAELA